MAERGTLYGSKATSVGLFGAEKIVKSVLLYVFRMAFSLPLLIKANIYYY